MKLLFEQQVILKGVFMAKLRIKSLRNLAVVGHGRNGKTSLCESLLFVSGKSETIRQGPMIDIVHGFFEPEEKKRRVSISPRAKFLLNGKT